MRRCSEIIASMVTARPTKKWAIEDKSTTTVPEGPRKVEDSTTGIKVSAMEPFRRVTTEHPIITPKWNLRLRHTRHPTAKTTRIDQGA